MKISILGLPNLEPVPTSARPDTQQADVPDNQAELELRDFGGSLPTRSSLPWGLPCCPVRAAGRVDRVIITVMKNPDHQVANDAGYTSNREGHGVGKIEPRTSKSSIMRRGHHRGLSSC